MNNNNAVAKKKKKSGSFPVLLLFSLASLINEFRGINILNIFIIH